MMKDAYPYLYETHLHTSQGSKCGKNTAVEMAQAAKAAGYTGIIITEHNWGGNTCVDKTLPWEQWVAQFMQGYYDAKAWGDGNGLDVFWGYEAGFQATDFLVYGITPQWLLEHPQLRGFDMTEHHLLVREAGGMVIHAHPFREAPYIHRLLLCPQLVDGVEGINAAHSRPSVRDVKEIFNEKAIQYARAHDLPITAGSDIHSINLSGGGIATRTKLTCIQDYCDLIRENGDYILTNGTAWFDKHGKVLQTMKNTEA